jgi:hypothetical protein
MGVSSQISAVMALLRKPGFLYGKHTGKATKSKPRQGWASFLVERLYRNRLDFRLSPSQSKVLSQDSRGFSNAT